MSNLKMDPAFNVLIKQPRESLVDANIIREAILSARLEPTPFNADVEVEELFLPLEGESKTRISLRIYRKANVTGALPVLLYLHGGGFFCGDHLSDESQCVEYALGAACAVVCVAYRLAPEDPFPAALTDCYQALEFVSQQSERLKFNRDLIAVGGSSAGANLAAAVALQARNSMGPKLCFQMLVVPALDDRLETQSAREFTDVPDFARPEAEIMWRWYLGETPADVSLYAAPSRAEDLSGLPPAYLLCAGLDPLRDEGLLYANRLVAAGVPVELHLVPSIPHGFASVPSASISKRLLSEQIDILRGAFAHRSS